MESGKLFNRLKNIYQLIKNLNFSVENYKKEAIVQSLPVVAGVNRAKKLIEKKRYDEAEEILLKSLDIAQDALVYKYLGKISEERSQFKQAVDYYVKSCLINPEDKEIWLRRGMCELYSGLFENSILSFENANHITPNNTDIYTGWGMAYMRLKKYAHAKDKFLTAARINKYNYTAILLSAVMERRLGDYNSAEEKLQFLVKVAPNESSYYEYANLKLIKSDYDNAEVYAKKALEFNKQMLPAYFILGEIYSIKKESKKTHEIFQTAIENDLDGSILHFEWGKACVRLLDFGTAKKEFLIALKNEENFVDAKTAMALIYAYENNFELLNELYEKNSANVYIQEAQGLKYCFENNLDRAIEMFKMAVKTDANQSYNYLHLANIYKKLGDISKTKEYFEKFVQINYHYINGFLEYEIKSGKGYIKG